jgi:hypothetical protein
LMSAEILPVEPVEDALRMTRDRVECVVTLRAASRLDPRRVAWSPA